MGAMSMLLRGAEKVAARSAGKLPHAVDMPGFHWSHTPDLVSTNPALYGTGIKGAEAARLQHAPDVRSRTYFYTDEARKEPGLGAHQFTGTLKEVYPAGDPLGLMAQARKASPQDPATAFERAVRKAGYKGYESGPDKAAVYFEPVRVAPHKQGSKPTAPRAAEAGITDTTEVMPGTRSGHMLGAPPEHERKLMDWLERDRTYEKLGLAPQSETTTGFYPNPHTGEIERNLLRAETVGPEGEQAVDTYGTLRNIMLGQNARAYSGVGLGDDLSSGVGMRVNLAGHTPEQMDTLLSALGDAGFAAPTGRNSLNIGRFSGSEDDAVAALHGELERAGLSHATARTGPVRAAYDEYDWSQPGSGQLTREHIVPRLLRDPELVKQMDLTGEPQQLARGLSSADSAAASRFGLQPRADIQSLRSTIAQQGLRGLLRRVQEQGYAGLPAAGALSLQPEEGRQW